MEQGKGSFAGRLDAGGQQRLLKHRCEKVERRLLRRFFFEALGIVP
jgi:hypothetical protein